MSGLPVIATKTIDLVDRKGKSRSYILSEIPATYSREIVANWFVGALPRVGEYKLNEEMMFKLLAYVGVRQGKDGVLWLKTRELVDNHVPDLKTLEALEMEMARYNWDFFLAGDLSNLSTLLVKALKDWITQIMTASLPQSSEPGKPPTTNSAQFTH